MNTNGYSVQYAKYAEGYFIQTGPVTWRENDKFEFIESARDESSVYLDDPSRKVWIQIDLYRKKIRYSDPQTPARDQYDLLSARSVVGWTAGTVVFPAGGGKRVAFVQTRPKNWEERNSDPKTEPFKFDE